MGDNPAMEGHRPPPGLARARADLDAGRRWKARDRLQGLVRARPDDPEVLDLLGQVLFDMGDLPAAGRYWYLCERDDDPARRAREAFEARWGDHASRARQLPVYAPLAAYPPTVQTRVRDLVPLLPSRAPNSTGPSDVTPGWKAKLFGVVVLVLTVGVWLVGLVVLVALAISWAV